MSSNIAMARKKNRSKAFTSKHRNILVGLLLAMAILVVYTPAIKSGYIWDDDAHVLTNQQLRSLNGLKKIWFDIGATQQYYPMVYSIFWLEYHLWGLNPLGYHLVNVLVHAANALLLWLVLRRLEISGALLIAAVFALHPVQVESVAWITEHKNTVSGFFYLFSMLICIRFFKLDVASSNQHPSPNTALLKPSGKKRSWRSYLLSLFLFVCALFSKTVTCTMPAVLLLLLWWRRKRIGLNDFLLLVPFFLLSTVFGLTTIWVEKHYAGAIGEEWTLPVIDRFLVAGRALWFYAGKLLWPQKLTFIYPKWEISSAIWWQSLFPLTAATAIVVLWLLRRRLGKAPLVAVLFFAGTLFPALGFFNVYPHKFSFVADHFQYLASIGLIALGVSVAMKFFSRFDNEKKYVRRAFSLMLLFVLGLLTWRQGHIYKDRETLYRDTIVKNHKCWMAYNNLGLALEKQGRIQEAIKNYSQALQIKPNYAGAHNNLGLALGKQGHTKKATDHFLQALRINPDYAAAHNNLGLTLEKQGRIQEAIDHYLLALQIKPDFVKALYNLGPALYKQGRISEAIDHLSQALRIDPDCVEAHYNLGNIFDRQDRTQEAADHYRQALRIKPDFVQARIAIGAVLDRQGRIEEAIGHYLQVIKIKPDFVEAYIYVGLSFLNKGNTTGAITLFREALRINPNSGLAKRYFEKALMLQQQNQ